MDKLEKEKSIKNELKKVEDSGKLDPKELTEEEKMLKDLEEQRKKSEKEGNKFNVFNADIDKKIGKEDDKDEEIKVGGFGPAPGPDQGPGPAFGPDQGPGPGPGPDPGPDPGPGPDPDPVPEPVPAQNIFDLNPESSIKSIIEKPIEPGKPLELSTSELDTSELDISDPSLLAEKELLPERGVTDQIVEEQKLEEEISDIPPPGDKGDKEDKEDKDLGIPVDKVPEAEDKVVTHEIYTGCKRLQKRLNTEKILKSTDLDKLDGCEKLGVNPFLKPLPSAE